MKLGIFIAVMLLGCSHAQHAGGGGGGGEHGGGGGPVPPAVRKTIDDMIGADAKVSSEREDGKLTFEAAKRTKLEVEVDEQGQLLHTELAIPVASLPTAVASAMSAKGKIGEAEAVISPTGVTFEVEIGETEYVVDATGKILSTEHEEGEENEEHEDNDKD
jgi:hypothetical protein